MKNIIIGICIATLGLQTLEAQEPVIVIEGPVEVISSKTVPGEEIYWVSDSSNVRYRVVLPEVERARLRTFIRDSPGTLVHFDGTIVNDDESRVLNVRRWNTTTTKTAVTDQNGNTRIVEKTTSTLAK